MKTCLGHFFYKIIKKARAGRESGQRKREREEKMERKKEREI
jgi:hypothetical protein